MSEWLKLYSSAFTHPKTRRMAKRLGVRPAAVVGHMASLWSFTAEFAPDGDLSRFDTEEIELAADWGGAEGDFVAAAKASGYLDGNGNGLIVHDWPDYGGRLVEHRASERKRSADRRATAVRTPDVQRATSGRRERVEQERTRGEEKTLSRTKKASALAYSPAFERWWRTSGRIGSKADASLLYEWWRGQGASEEELLRAVVNDRKHCQRVQQTPRHGATFLAKNPNRWCEWLDEEHGSGRPDAADPEMSAYDLWLYSKQQEGEDAGTRDIETHEHTQHGLPAPKAAAIDGEPLC